MVPLYCDVLAGVGVVLEHAVGEAWKKAAQEMGVVSLALSPALFR